MATRRADQQPRGAGLAASFDPARTESMRYFDDLLHGKPLDVAAPQDEPAPDSADEPPSPPATPVEGEPASAMPDPVADLVVASAPTGGQEGAPVDERTDTGAVSSSDEAPPALVVNPGQPGAFARPENARPARKGRRLPPLPDERELPVHLDAAYAPRQVFLRVPSEVRDRLRRLKNERRAGGEPLTDGAALEEGLRLLPDDPSELAALYVSYARKRVPASVAMSPHVRPEIHLWLGDVTDTLVQMGVRASVNQLAQLALSRLP